MIPIHEGQICDNRELESIDIRDYLDSYFCEIRESAGMLKTDEEIRDWLRAHLDRRGHGAKQDLAKYLGFARPDAITRMLNTDPKKETRQIKQHEYAKMLEFFGEQESTPPVIPVLGYLGAGAEVAPEYEQVPPEGLYEVSVPFALPAEMGAFEVRGDSMRPVYRDGHVIIVYLQQKKPIEAFYGEEAAVRTAEGRRFIKTITKGPNGTVNLTSWNAAPIEEQHLEWIGEIFAVLPPASVRHMGREEAATLSRASVSV
jgi:phage repressor protein C with HTH and peptisase S24 domain